MTEGLRVASNVLSFLGALGSLLGAVLTVVQLLV